MAVPLRAALFDKDGTLIDFHATWGPAVAAGLEAAASDEVTLAAASEAIGYDQATATIRADSVFIAESNEVIFATLAQHVDVDVFMEACMATAATSTAPADGLPALLHTLRDRGVRLGIATNDWVEIAEDQLGILGWSDLFDAVMGSDSGFGAKPQPDMLIEGARRLGAEPGEVVMIGDTAHDLHAGRAAGMTTVLVTGSGGTREPSAELVGGADIVVASLADLEGELANRGLLA